MLFKTQKVIFIKNNIICNWKNFGSNHDWNIRRKI